MRHFDTVPVTVPVASWYSYGTDNQLSWKENRGVPVKSAIQAIIKILLPIFFLTYFYTILLVLLVHLYKIYNNQ